MKILFFGTSFISKVYLENLHKNNHEVFVVTVPDKRALRGQKFIYKHVKIYAIKNNINFIQPKEFTYDVINDIKKFYPDIGVVVAYGKIIPETIFNIPKYKTFNIHFSMLPKYRGAAPVEYALCNGEHETGVSSFYISEKLDAGNIIIQKKLSININDNAKTLFDKLIPLGVDIMNETLRLKQSALLGSVPQIGYPSFAPILKKENGIVNWSRSSSYVYNQFRGLYIWPGIYSVVSKGKLIGKRIKFIEIEIFDSTSINKNFGEICFTNEHKKFIVLCAVGKILIIKLQLESKRIVTALDFIYGRQFIAGDRFF
ncbi:MAG: methionyl-tRNA formyltransferase [Endomicrobium sp.]|nr:methionyl-tRNA formyltransferase [Endomicrobium sp.]